MTCVICKKNKAVFYSYAKKKIRADKDHDLCPRCFRTTRSKQQAVLLKEKSTW